MPRRGRNKSKSGIYHVMVRGINRQNIFDDEEDRQKYITLLQKTKEISQCEFYGYCLMSNHVHMLVREGKEEISQIMKRIGVSYAYWFNGKYERSGHLFQDRYKSESVEDDSYLLAVLRYLHQEPVKTRLVDIIGDYPWSSYNAYIAKNPEGLIDTGLVLGLFKVQPGDAVNHYIQFMSEANHIQYLEDKEKKKCSDDDISCELAKLAEKKRVNGLNAIGKKERDEILRKLKAIEEISMKHIATLLP